MNLPPALLSTGLLGFKKSLYLVWFLWPFSKSDMSVLCIRPVSIRQLKRYSISVKISPCSDRGFSRPPDGKTKRSPEALDLKEKQSCFSFPLISTCDLVQNAPMKVSLCNCSTIGFCNSFKVSQISCLTLCSVLVS